MEVIIYSHADNSQKDLLLKQISRSIHLAPVMIFSFDGLFQLLKVRISEEIIIVFLISSESELNVLLESRSHLFNTRFIIILPDTDDDLMSKGLSLQPRYLGYQTKDHSDVGKVLRKMIQK